MDGLLDQWAALWPALAFLLTGVPLAALLDRLGFFESVAVAIAGRSGRDVPVLAFWLLAAATTIVLNLDTTIVLLTPLYLRLARHAGLDPVPFTAIPLLLASLASSVLPVSNLTNLIVAERLDTGVTDIVIHLGLPSLVSIVVGWSLYRRRHPTLLDTAPTGTPDRRALLVGGGVTIGLLIGFVLGPLVGIEAWMCALAADIVLVAVTRHVPWRSVPVATAAAVAAVAALAAVVVPADATAELLRRDHPLALVGTGLVGAAGANLVNNLPALLVGIDGSTDASWGVWAWLLGVNAAAVLTPLGALANLLWLRILRSEGEPVGVKRYLALVVPIALPAFMAALLTLAGLRLIGR